TRRGRMARPQLMRGCARPYTLQQANRNVDRSPRLCDRSGVLMSRLVLPLMLLGAVYPLSAGEPTPAWPQLLGPRRDGIVRESGLNVDWQAKRPKTLWKVPLGSACSSLTIVGDRVYTMAKRDQRDGIVCLEADSGKERWFTDAVPTYLDAQRQGAGPR